MKITILNIDYHRNGVCGAPFHAIVFRDRGPANSVKLGLAFEEPGHCAVLDIAKLADGDTEFGSNSWRSDTYETALRQAIEVFACDGDMKDGRQATNDKSVPMSSDDDNYSSLVDFLTDARHWCHVNGHSFQDALDTAAMHFAAETNGDDGISIGWSVEDVQEIRPGLTASQARTVLHLVEDQHDATRGITWDTLEFAAQELFGAAADSSEA